jgi:hypothetical protein
MNNILDKHETVGIVSQHYMFEEAALLVTNRKGILQDLSSAAISLFGLEFKDLWRNVHIEQLVPRVIRNIDRFKDGKMVTLREQYAGGDMRECKVKAEPIWTSVAGDIGFVVRLVLVHSQLSLQAPALATPFRFRPHFKDKYQLAAGYDLEDQEVEIQLEQASEGRLPTQERVDYSAGIRKQRYIDNRLIDVESQCASSQEEEKRNDFHEETEEIRNQKIRP